MLTFYQKVQVSLNILFIYSPGIINKKRSLMALLELESYRKKGINAYLSILGGSNESFDYGKPIDENAAQASYKNKIHTVVIDLKTKPDGKYIYKEASGHRTKYGYLFIEEGDVLAEFDTEKELRDFRSAVILPELEGTEKQIIWAEGIRDKFIQAIGDRITNWGKDSAAYEGLSRTCSAKTWIDNRDKLNPEKFISLAKKLELEWKLSEEREALTDEINEEESKARIVYDDEVLDEVDLYAVVYADRIEVTANEPGMSDRIPENRKYIGNIENICWRYELDRLDEIVACKAIDFVLKENGDKIR